VLSSSTVAICCACCIGCLCFYIKRNADQISNQEANSNATTTPFLVFQAESRNPSLQRPQTLSLVLPLGIRNPNKYI